MADFRPILCVDFDGVVHGYSRGWQNGEIYDPPVPGFKEWADKARQHFNLVIYSSRSWEDSGREAMRAWMTARGIDASWFEFAAQKPPAFMTIDDRAVCFRGDWSAAELTPEALRAFKPWNAR